jgi:hypothetical protein
MAGRPPIQYLSPDGQSFWDGIEWRPVSSLPPGYAPQPYYAPQMQPYPMQPMYAAPALQPSNGIGTAAGVLGIITAVLMFVPVVNYLSVLLGIMATIFGGVGIRKANRIPGTPKGMAVTGLVLGIIGIVISLIFIIGVYAYLFRRSAPWI